MDTRPWTCAEPAAWGGGGGQAHCLQSHLPCKVLPPKPSTLLCAQASAWAFFHLSLYPSLLSADSYSSLHDFAQLLLLVLDTWEIGARPPPLCLHSSHTSLTLAASSSLVGMVRAWRSPHPARGLLGAGN